jgi:hypothetical protein
MIPVGEHVWIFSGNRSRLPSAIFATQAQAERWIEENRATGTLIVYPVHVSAYEWAVAVGVFRPKSPSQESPEFIANFCSSSQHRFQFEDGLPSLSRGPYRRRPRLRREELRDAAPSLLGEQECSHALAAK